MDVRLEIDKWCYRLWRTLEPNKNVLEVGCGGRSNTMLMFSDSHNFYPTNNIINEDWVLKESTLLDVENMREANIVKVIPQFDLIICSQVMEHCKHPALALYNIYSHLTDGGILLLTTPLKYRIHEFDKDDGQTTEVGVLDYWRFTPNGYRLLFTEAGFEEFYIGQIGEELFPDVVVGIAWKRLGQPQRELNVWDTEPIPPSWAEEMSRKVLEYKEKVSWNKSKLN